MLEMLFASAMSGGGDSSEPPAPPPPVDYSAAIEYESDTNKTTALAQINESSYELMQSSQDRQMQNAANLELGMETLDTKLQTDQLDYVQQMTAEEDRHIESLAGSASQLQQLQSTYSMGSDLPPPTDDTSY